MSFQEGVSTPYLGTGPFIIWSILALPTSSVVSHSGLFCVQWPAESQTANGDPHRCTLHRCCFCYLECRPLYLLHSPKCFHNSLSSFPLVLETPEQRTLIPPIQLKKSFSFPAGFSCRGHWNSQHIILQCLILCSLNPPGVWGPCFVRTCPCCSKYSTWWIEMQKTKTGWLGYHAYIPTSIVS